MSNERRKKMLRKAEELDWEEDLYNTVRELQALGQNQRQINTLVGQALRARPPVRLRERVLASK